MSIVNPYLVQANLYREIENNVKMMISSIAEEKGSLEQQGGP